MPKIVPRKSQIVRAALAEPQPDSASDNVRDLYRRPTPISLLLIELPAKNCALGDALEPPQQNRRTLMSSIMLVAFVLSACGLKAFQAQFLGVNLSAKRD